MAKNKATTIGSNEWISNKQTNKLTEKGGESSWIESLGNEYIIEQNIHNNTKCFYFKFIFHFPFLSLISNFKCNDERKKNSIHSPMANSE